MPASRAAAFEPRGFKVCCARMVLSWFFCNRAEKSRDLPASLGPVRTRGEQRDIVGHPDKRSGRAVHTLVSTCKPAAGVGRSPTPICVFTASRPARAHSCVCKGSKAGSSESGLKELSALYDIDMLARHTVYVLSQQMGNYCQSRIVS